MTMLGTPELAVQTPPAAKNGTSLHHHHTPHKIPTSIVEAIRTEMRVLVDGNLDDNLIQIEQLASRTRELFMTFKAPHARFNRHGGPLTFATGYGYSGAMSMDTSSYQQAIGHQAPNPEQFGAKAIRELIALLPEILNARSDANSPDKLVEAIALAKKNGETDLAKVLTDRLLAKPEDIVAKLTSRLTSLVQQPTPPQLGEGFADHEHPAPSEQQADAVTICTTADVDDGSNGVVTS